MLDDVIELLEAARTVAEKGVDLSKDFTHIVARQRASITGRAVLAISADPGVKVIFCRATAELT